MPAPVKDSRTPAGDERGDMLATTAARAHKPAAAIENLLSFFMAILALLRWRFIFQREAILIALSRPSPGRASTFPILARPVDLYAVEAPINGRDARERHQARQQEELAPAPDAAASAPLRRGYFLGPLTSSPALIAGLFFAARACVGPHRSVR
jgi:hypothetical protein